MKILLLSYSLTTSSPALRLKKALESRGEQVTLLTMTATEGVAAKKGVAVITPSHLYRMYEYVSIRLKNAIFRFIYRNKKPSYFSVGNLGIPYRYLRKYVLEADVVNLHWVTGFINYDDIEKIRRDAKKVIWTLHDCRPFTGGCHHDEGCNGFEKDCGRCPLLNSKNVHDITHYIMKRSRRSLTAYLNDNKNPKGSAEAEGISSVKEINIVAPGTWMAERVSRSSLFGNSRCSVIPNALDLNIFKPLNRQSLREEYNIPEDARVILTGAVHMDSPYKGFEKLKEIITKLPRDIFLLTFGRVDDLADVCDGINLRQFGYIDDESEMARIYNLADVFVLPSLHENLPTVVMESMACGTPVTAFDVGSVRDMMSHKEDGYVATCYDADDFVEGVEWCMEYGRVISGKAVDRIRTYADYGIVGNKYTEAYSE